MAFPIHCSCDGPERDEPAVIHDPRTGTIKEYMTNNPIPEGTKFVVQYGGYTIRFELEAHFYSDPNLSTIRVLNVMERLK